MESNVPRKSEKTITVERLIKKVISTYNRKKIINGKSDASKYIISVLEKSTLAAAICNVLDSETIMPEVEEKVKTQLLKGLNCMASESDVSDEDFYLVVQNLVAFILIWDWETDNQEIEKDCWKISKALGRFIYENNKSKEGYHKFYLFIRHIILEIFEEKMEIRKYKYVVLFKFLFFLTKYKQNYLAFRVMYLACTQRIGLVVEANLMLYSIANEWIRKYFQLLWRSRKEHRVTELISLFFRLVKISEKNIDERLGISVKNLIETMLRDSSCALAVMHMFRDVYGSNVQSDFIKIVKNATVKRGCKDTVIFYYCFYEFIDMLEQGIAEEEALDKVSCFVEKYPTWDYKKISPYIIYERIAYIINFFGKSNWNISLLLERFSLINPYSINNNSNLSSDMLGFSPRKDERPGRSIFWEDFPDECNQLFVAIAQNPRYSVKDLSFIYWNSHFCQLMSVADYYKLICERNDAFLLRECPIAVRRPKDQRRKIWIPSAKYEIASEEDYLYMKNSNMDVEFAYILCEDSSVQQSAENTVVCIEGWQDNNE